MPEVKGLFHHNNIQIMGILHNSFLIRPTWVHLVHLRHTSQHLDTTGAARFQWALRSFPILFVGPLGLCLL